MNFAGIIRLALLLLMLGLWIGCQQEDNKASAEVDRLYQEYNLQPSKERAEVYLDSLDSFVRSNITKTDILEPFLSQGVEVSMAEGALSRTTGYLLPLLRLYPNLENRKERLISLGDVMFALRKRHASSIIYSELNKQYPGDPLLAKKIPLIDSTANVQSDFIKYLSDNILVDPDDSGINRASALKYVDGTEAFALVSPSDERVPGHLYRAAEVARSMRTFPKAMSLYDWLIEGYPNYEKTPTALFIKGFILEQDYDRKEEAKQIYQEFIAKFPKHQMAESAQFLLDNIDKSDEEIMQTIEKRKNANQ